MEISKKIWSILLAVLLTVSTFPVAAVSNVGIKAEAKAENYDMLEYDISNGEATILGYDENLLTGNFIVPESIEGCPVTSIDDYAFSYCEGLTSITIPDSVTDIGEYAFAYCDNLSSIKIPDSVIHIGVSSVDETAYYNNPSNWENGVLYISNHLIEADVSGEYTVRSGVTNICDEAFSCCGSLTGIIIPDSVISIGKLAFAYCDNLSSIKIPDSVIHIGDSSVYRTAYFDDPSNWENGVLYISNHLIEADVSGEYTVRSGVTNICDSAFGGCTDLTSITIPDSVTSIGNGAFSRCRSLTSVTIPNSVTNIGDGAFESCEDLTSITIPDSVKSIGNGAFYGCSGLTSITVDSGNTVYDSRDNCNAIIETETNTLISGCKNTVIPNSVTSIGDYAFSGCTGLTSITIPNSVKNIGDFAFGDCTGLTSITIPNSVESIGFGAFAGCTGLTSVTIPNSVTSIDGWAFDGCAGLTSVTIPNSVTSIGGWAFDGCTGLTSVTIPNSVKNIGDFAFGGCESLTIYGYSGSAAEKYANENGIKFKIPCQHSNTARFEKVEPQSCTQPGYTAGTFCNDCKQWIEGHEEITVPHTDKNSDNICDVCSSNLKEIIDSGKCGNNAVYVLYGDGELVISGKGEISEGAFDSYYRFSRSVIKVNIENGITGIGDYAFDYSEKISSIIIPDSVESIGESAFYGCTGLTSITIPNSVTSIGDCAFSDCTGLTSVTIPSSVKSIGGSAFEDCTGLTSVTIGNSVTSIGEYAFYYCTGLTSVTVDSKNTVYDSRDNCNAIIETATNTLISGCKNTVIPNSVESIGDGAFYYCTDLTSITIPNSITSIGKDAFSWCTGLTSITIPNSVESIGDGAFYDCTDLTNITIPDSVTSIGNYAFDFCTGLTSVTIPSSVTSIGEGAFEDCDNLTIYGYSGSAAEKYANENGIKFIALVEEHTHTFGEWKLTKSATCFENGTKERSCTGCEEKETQIISKLAHSYTGTVKANNDGTHSFKCVNGCNKFGGTTNCSGGVATCKDKAVCSVCNAEYGTITDHSYNIETTPATTTVDGKVETKCSVCGDVSDTAIIFRPETITLSAYKYTYTGKLIKPTVTVKDVNGQTISPSNYTVKYSNNTNSGTGKVLVKFDGNYYGIKILSFTIKPKQVTGLKASTVKTDSIKLSWSNTSGAKYYKVERSTDGKKWTTVTTTSKTNYTVKKLSSGKKYRFRVTALDSKKEISGKASSILKTGTLTVAPKLTLKSTKSKTATASWKKVTGASKYVVYKSTNGKKWTKAATTTKTTYTLKKLTGGKKVYVKVTAVNAYGKASAYSSVKNISVKK